MERPFDVAGAGIFSVSDSTGDGARVFVFIICMTVIMLPKVLALVDLALDPNGAGRSGIGAGDVECAGGDVFSTLHAPLQMLWHTRFVITIVLGMGVSWGAES